MVSDTPLHYPPHTLFGDTLPSSSLLLNQRTIEPGRGEEE